MKQLTIVILLLIAASITLSAVSYQLDAIAAKDQQIEILKEMLKESNDRERGFCSDLYYLGFFVNPQEEARETLKRECLKKEARETLKRECLKKEGK